MPGLSLTPSPRRAVAAWLFVCAGFVLAMVVVGGITRLTRSGLSIVEWKPITGVLAAAVAGGLARRRSRSISSRPRASSSTTAWTSRRSSRIFFVEWLHRLLGRVVGVVVLVPFLFFAVTRRLSAKRAARVLLIFALGGVQGFLGWFMVKSGLETRRT